MGVGSTGNQDVNGQGNPVSNYQQHHQQQQQQFNSERSPNSHTNQNEEQKYQPATGMHTPPLNSSENRLDSPLSNIPLQVQLSEGLNI